MSDARQPLIWVVEDNDQNFELVDFLLDEAGYRVLRATSGGELAALLAGDETPALILLDIGLPGRSGLELVGDVAASRHAAAPIVALTAHAMSGDRARILAAGCSGYLAKPIETASFVASVERYLRHRDGDR